MGARLRLRPGFRTACRRRDGRLGQVRSYESLREFASSPGRVLSRLVALFFFFCVRARLGVFCHIVSYLVVIFRFLVISRHFSSQNGFPGYGGQRAVAAPAGQGRAAVCCAWFPHRAPDVKNDMTLILSWPTVAAGPRLRSFMFRTIVRQNRGVCSAWNFQDSFQNGGGLLRCSEGAGCSAVVRTVIHAVDMMETVDGSGSGGVFIHEKQVNYGSIVARGDLHPSPPGAVLQQAREPKLAAGETAATPGTRSQKFGMQPAAHPS